MTLQDIAQVQPFPEYEDQRFRIDGGDGDQTLFGQPMILQRVTASWFNGELGQFPGRAWLVRVVNNPRNGLLLGLTPRTLGEIEADIAESGWKSVIVHGVDFPGYDPEKHGPISKVGGMSFLERLGSESGQDRP